MRPDAPHDPCIELGEELADVSPLVIVAPTAQLRVQLLYQPLSSDRCAPTGKLAHLFLETPDRFLARVRVQRPRWGSPSQLTVAQLSGPAALDLIPQELKPKSDVHDPCFLRIQMHSQSFQDPESVGQSRTRLRRRLAGDDPVSRPGGSHPEPLSEPCLNLAAHTA